MLPVRIIDQRAEWINSRITADKTSHAIEVALSVGGIQDDDIPHILDSIELLAEELLRSQEDSRELPDSVEIIDVNLSLEMNFISSLGLKSILDRSLLWHSIETPKPVNSLRIKRLRLHMCRMDDHGARFLADYLAVCLEPYLPAEIHLSHNRISVDGAKALIQIASKRYPYFSEVTKRYVPLWLRLERNNVNYPALEAVLNDPESPISWCSRIKPSHQKAKSKRDNRKQWWFSECGATSCVVNLSEKVKSGSIDPISLHLPYLDQQRPEDEQTLHFVDLLHKTKANKKKDRSKSIEFNEAISRFQELSLDEDQSAPSHRSFEEEKGNPIFVVLDTSAILRMMGNDHACISFSNLIPSKTRLNNKPVHNQHEETDQVSEGGRTDTLLDGSFYFVLLETVLQQLDDNRKIHNLTNSFQSSMKYQQKIRQCVATFMRAYPEYSKQGVLIRLLSEDIEDTVRGGGFNASSSPGCRLQNGKFDSDGLIIDSALLLWRSLLSSSESDPDQPPSNVILLTSDVYMVERSHAVGLPCALWEDMEESIVKQKPKESSTAQWFYDALPNSDKQLLKQKSILSLASTENQDKTSENPALTVSGRLAHTELSNAANMIEDLSNIIRDLIQDHKCPVVQEACSLCIYTKETLTRAENYREIWKRMYLNKTDLSLVHTSLYSKRSASKSMTTENSMLDVPFGYDEMGMKANKLHTEKDRREEENVEDQKLDSKKKIGKKVQKGDKHLWKKLYQ